MVDWRAVAASLSLPAGYIMSGMVVTLSMESTSHINATSFQYYDKEHTFDHWFFMRLCMFLGQFACLGFYKLFRKREVEPRPPERERPREAILRAKRELLARVERERKNENQSPTSNGVAGRASTSGAAGPAVRESSEDVMVNGGYRGATSRPVESTPGSRGAGPREVHQDEQTERGGVRARRPQRGDRPRRNSMTLLRTKEKRGMRKIVFLMIALFDYSRTAFLFVALKQTYPSAWIMFQGIGVISTCILTVTFVGKEKTVKKMQWVGAVFSLLGMAGIGLRDFFYSKDTTYDPYGIAAGCLLYSMCGLVWAIQILLEQRYLRKHDLDPLVVVGYEGMYGTVFTTVLLLPYYFSRVGAFNSLPFNRLEDPIDAILQMISNPIALLPFVGSAVCLPLFYLCGNTLTKRSSAVYRIGVEVPVPVIAWLLYIIVGWQPFHVTQLGGIAGVILGVFCYFLPTDPIERRIKRWWRRIRGLPEVVEQHVENVDGQEHEDDEDNAETRPLLTPESPGLQYVRQPKQKERSRPM